MDNPGTARLSEDQILGWADAWQPRGAGQTAIRASSPAAGGITWAPWRDVTRGNLWSPRRLAARATVVGPRSVRRTPRVPHLTVEQILAWADEHYRWTRTWPKVLSGSIFGAAHESWSKVDQALRVGVRGLPGGSSLAGLLAERRGIRNPKAAPQLSETQVLAWADSFRCGRNRCQEKSVSVQFVE